MSKGGDRRISPFGSQVSTTRTRTCPGAHWQRCRRSDAAQSAFLDAFRHLRRFDETREFYPWFYVLLRNRSFKQWVPAQDRASESEQAEVAAPRINSPEDLYDLRTALDCLPVGDRELIVLKHLDGWTYDELAERLEIPRGTVMSRLFHARQRLKALMFRPGGGAR